jgi:hypothetical protein
MPPADSGIAPLTTDELEVLRQWVREGAKYEAHWAFTPPQSPAPPPVSEPDWCRNELDRFVLAGLDRAGLAPEPEADLLTLGRRAALTLTGLPLTPDEADALLADTRPGAYERLVDRLLASPRYGEHQARYWLDAVRYGDTHGLHLDNERLAWPYRDWVVRALNEDLPFDQFTVWQLAGDMLPEPTLDQRVASGYIRMNPTTNEGGAIVEEFLAKNTFDRVDTTSTVFLGVTMACARCHDHKYDPFTQRDYFRLFAYFNSTAESALDGNLLAPEPTVLAPGPELAAEISAANAHVRRIERSVDPQRAEAWLATAAPEGPRAGDWEASGPHKAASYQAAFETDFGPEPDGADSEVEWRPVELEEGKEYAGAVQVENAAVYLRTTLVAEREAKVALELASDDGVVVWLGGRKVHSNPALRPLSQAADRIEVQVPAGKSDLLVKVVNGPGAGGYRLALASEAGRRVAALRATVGQDGFQRSRELARVYLLFGPEPSADYAAAAARLAKLEAAVPRALVAAELPKPRPAFVLRRGEYDQPTEPVERGLPSALAGGAEAPKDRLGLARWLVGPENPLVSRVFVNRVWQQHFGTGIVRTAEDFGNQGEWPMDRALLDYLAVNFRENGWSQKRLHRLIVTSSAFRQSSRLSPQKRERDPENRLASRGPRFRLDAEVVRDQALWAAGILNEQRGGQGDKPYQPAGLWEAIAFLESTTSRYVQDTGPRLYRRSIYLFWKRTSPHPTMLTFDAPMRESCVVRRSRTNTPLQALVTLNETGFVEAARKLAERCLAVEGTDAARLAKMFRIATGRLPEREEAGLLAESLARHRERFRAAPGEAARFLAVGEYKTAEGLDPVEVASYALVANTVLNLDEVLTQH